jgi:hypothetical protein
MASLVPQAFDGIGRGGFPGAKAHGQGGHGKRKKRSENKILRTQPYPGGVSFKPLPQGEIGRRPSDRVGRRDRAQEFPVTVPSVLLGQDVLQEPVFERNDEVEGEARILRKLCF